MKTEEHINLVCIKSVLTPDGKGRKVKAESLKQLAPHLAELIDKFMKDQK